MLPLVDQANCKALCSPHCDVFINLKEQKRRFANATKFSRLCLDGRGRLKSQRVIHDSWS